MGANSKHYGDIYRWIEKIIESSNDVQQEQSVLNLIYLYNKNCRQIESALSVSEILKLAKHNESIHKQTMELIKKSNNHFLEIRKKKIW